MISLNSIIGFRRNFSIIRNQFWTPVDRRFSEILNDLSKHKALFERALALVHAEEMYNYYDIVDREVKRNAEWRNWGPTRRGNVTRNRWVSYSLD